MVAPSLLRNRFPLILVCLLVSAQFFVHPSASSPSVRSNGDDADSDGFNDTMDDCPNIWGNSTQPPNVGCPDKDGDGYSDVDDSHPNDSNQWTDIDGDGYGDNTSANNGDAFPLDPTQWRDSDGDGHGDNQSGNDSDAFPFEPTQWNDADGDNFGDNPSGIDADDCITEPGYSTRDRTGCPDEDGDGTSDDNDAFLDHWSQWNDSDGDGFGDNWGNPNWNSSRKTHWPGEFIAGAQDSDPSPLDFDDDGYEDENATAAIIPYDDCPEIPGTSTEDRFGCSDVDGDGYSNEADDFPTVTSQWSDQDGDGYGDNPNGSNSDTCPTIRGGSLHDRRGCLDTDGDRWSDPTGPLSEYPWNESDGADLFPADATRWNRSHEIVETIGPPSSQTSDGGMAFGVGVGSLVTLCIALIFGVLVLRSRGDSEYDDESYEIEDEYAEPEIREDTHSVDTEEKQEPEEDEEEAAEAEEPIPEESLDDSPSAEMSKEDASAVLGTLVVDDPESEEHEQSEDDGDERATSEEEEALEPDEEEDELPAVKIHSTLEAIHEKPWALVTRPAELTELCELDPETEENIDDYWDHENEDWVIEDILSDLEIVREESGE